MPTKTDDPTKRYSDSELDPSERSFDDVVSNYGQTADPAQEDDNIQRLKEREASPDDPKASDSIKGEPDQETPNQYYNPDEQKPSFRQRFTNNRRRAAVIGAGGGAISISLFALLMSLLPLKIPGIMQMISDEAGQRVEQITERRAKVIVARAILQKFATSGSGITVTGDGPVGTLIASMRVNNFEKKLADKGLTIERNSEGVVLRVNDEKLGDGRRLKTEVEVMRALDGHPVTNKIIKDIVKEEIPSWRWMKKAKFAKWLRIKYGIHRYGVENSNNPDEDEAIKETNKSRLGPEYEAVANNADNAINDLMDGQTRDPHDSELVGSGGNSDIGNSTRDAAAEATEGNSDPRSGTTTTLVEKLSAKLSSKAIPVIGWIDFAAMVNHIVFETSENDLIGKISSYYRAMQYSRHFGVWSGYGSQIQLGAMNPAFIGVLATQTEGIEESEAFNMIEGTLNAGVKVKNKINANNITAISADVKEFTEYVGGYDSIQGKAVNLVLEAWYDVSNAVFGTIGEALGAAAGFITPQAVEDYLAKYVSIALGKIMTLIGLDFDPMVKGADWFNAAHGGATWTYNDFCKVEMGCRKLSPQQASIQNSSVAVERADYQKQQGVLYALFNPESSNSLVSRMAIAAPTDTVSAATKLSKLVTGTPATILGIITGKTSAAGYTDIHGVDPYGATENDLNQPLAEEAINGEECPEVPEDTYNRCLVDTMVAEAMVCEFIPDSEDCNDDNGVAQITPGEGAEFTVASYNILHSVSHTDTSIRIGGCGANPVPGDPRCMKTRGDRQVKIITGKFGNPAFDIFGTQETAPEQYDYLKKNLPGYAAFPETTERMNNMDDGAVAIFWNTAKFTMVENGKARGKSNTSKYITNPWVGLQTNSGQKVYVMSIHYAVAGFGGTPESIRESSNLTMDWVRSKATGDNIVIVVGDFNDRLPEQHYCIYTKNSAMQHAVDMSARASLNEGCTKRRFGGIDHIYATPSLGLTARNWTSMPDNGEIAKASDHVPVYTTYTIPSASGSVEGWSLPVDKSAWQTDGQRWLESHTAKSDAWTNNLKAGADINIGSDNDDCGKPVYSMLSGKIVPGAPSYTMQVVSEVNGKTVLITYAHGASMKTSGTVNSGDQIMTISNKGSYAGMKCHLHLEILYETKPICPQKILPAIATGKSVDLETTPGATYVCGG